MAGTTEFLAAVKTGDVATVKAMLAGLPLLASTRDTEGVSALLLSCFHGHPAVADLLLASGLQTDLFEAVTVGDLSRVRVLLETDMSSLDLYTTQGFTALGLAAFFGHAEVVGYLLDKGASIDAVDRSIFANTALDAAASRNQTTVALLLLTRGASVHVRDAAWHTPLHKAAFHGNADLIQALLSRGADPEARNQVGDTPLAMVPSDRSEVRRWFERQQGHPGMGTEHTAS